MIKSMRRSLFCLAVFFAPVLTQAEEGKVSLSRQERVWAEGNNSSNLYAHFNNTTNSSQIVYFSFDMELPETPGQKHRVSKCVEIAANSDLRENIGVDYAKYPGDSAAKVTKYTDFKIDEVVASLHDAAKGNWPELFSSFRIALYNQFNSRRPFLFRVDRVPTTPETLNAAKTEISQTVIENGIRFDIVRKADSPQLSVDSVYRLAQAKKAEKTTFTLAGGIFYEQFRDEQGQYQDKPNGTQIMVRGLFPAADFGPTGSYGSDGPAKIIHFTIYGFSNYFSNIDGPRRY